VSIAKIITAAQALHDELKLKAAGATHPLHIVEGWSFCSDLLTQQLPAVDVMPGRIMREGQHARAEIIFTIEAAVDGSYAAAAQIIYDIDRALFRVLFSQLTGTAAGRAFGSQLNYEGLITPPRPLSRGTEEAPEPCLQAVASATWNLKEPLS
jgi:hypothetical protein